MCKIPSHYIERNSLQTALSTRQIIHQNNTSSIYKPLSLDDLVRLQMAEWLAWFT